MVIVSDTSAISGLIQINRLSILEQLFHQIIIPTAVYNELLKLKTASFSASEFSWIKIQSPSNDTLMASLNFVLDDGEKEAIALAIELKADLLIIDEQKGREIAKQNGLIIVGLVGILLRAKEKKIIPSVKLLIDELIAKAGFWISPTFYQTILKQANEE